MNDIVKIGIWVGLVPLVSALVVIIIGIIACAVDDFKNGDFWEGIFKVLAVIFILGLVTVLIGCVIEHGLFNKILL